MKISFDITKDNFEQFISTIAAQFGYEVAISPYQEKPEVPEGDAPQEDIVEEEPVVKTYETKVLWGVNFRNSPLSVETYIYRMIPKGEEIHVMKEIDASWLEVEVQDGTVGYISSKSKYTTYSTKSLEDKKIDELIAYGELFLGAPYVFGASIGEVNEKGQRVFDCSSFTKSIFKDILNIILPRVSHNQAKEGIEVLKEDLQRGDLVFFTSRSLPIGHVGIYAGNNQIFHTYGSGGVKYTGFSGTQWEERFTTARRVYKI